MWVLYMVKNPRIEAYWVIIYVQKQQATNDDDEKK